MPVLDPQILQQLADETDPGTAGEFAATYRRMLPHRVTRIIRALNPWNSEDAMDAALSLQISSAMNGALVMERMCLELVEALNAASRHASREACRRIQAHLPQLKPLLDDQLAQLDAAA